MHSDEKKTGKGQLLTLEELNFLKDALHKLDPDNKIFGPVYTHIEDSKQNIKSKECVTEKDSRNKE